MHRIVCAALALLLLFPALGRAAAWQPSPAPAIDAPEAVSTTEAGASGASASDGRVPAARSARLPALLITLTPPPSAVTPISGDLRTDRRRDVLRSHPGRRLPRLQDFDEEH